MPAIDREFVLDVPPRTAWEHLTDMEFFASHLPGYVEYEEIDERTSHWTVEVDVRRFSQTITFAVTVLEEEFPDAVFSLDPFDQAAEGEGTLHLEPRPTADETETHVELVANATGTMSPVTNAVIKRALPTIGDAFIENLQSAEELNQS